jgi:hypothetical protein
VAKIRQNYQSIQQRQENAAKDVEQIAGLYQLSLFSAHLAGM